MSKTKKNIKIVDTNDDSSMSPPPSKSDWISRVKAYQAENGVTYKESLMALKKNKEQETASKPIKIQRKKKDNDIMEE